MKNGLMSGHVISVARVAASVGGVPYDLGAGLVGVASGDYAASELGEFELTGVKVFSKDAAVDFTVGEAVGFDIETGTVVKAANGDKDFDMGKAVEATVANADSVAVMVNGLPGPGPSYS